MPELRSAYGKIRLHYQHNGTPHTTSANLTGVVSFNSAAAMQSVADDLAGALCNIQPNTVTYTSWDSLDPYNDLALSGGYSAERTGVNVGAGHDWASFTITFTGKEITAGADGKHGNTDLRVFTGNAIEATPGILAFTVGDDISLAIVATFLQTDPRLWAGFHGIKAGVRGLYPVQFNAHEQRKRGC